ncbi:MAG: SMC-Scp complex subunit ScpB [Kangiellaceae bacterium]|jgi:segregation and condensation protein B|nr:SMC-Scp complex subunit ScpB [Kangiellaceae bacterium]
MTEEKLQHLLEAALMSFGKPMTIDRMLQLFDEDKRPTTAEVRTALSAINDACENRGVELKEVASGFRFQAKQEYAEWVSKLWEEKAPRYSRALLETLALIAYRQPITRSEIEDVRGVSVSSHIIKTLLEREWVRVVGHRDVPGRPALYATTKQFLDYFNLKSLEELPALSEIRDLDEINAELDLNPDAEQAALAQANQQADDNQQEEEGSDHEANLDDLEDSIERQDEPVAEQAQVSDEEDSENQEQLIEGDANELSDSEPSLATSNAISDQEKQQLEHLQATMSERLTDDEIVEAADLANEQELHADDSVFDDSVIPEEIDGEQPANVEQLADDQSERE